MGEGSRAGAATPGSAITRIERAVADSCARQAEWPTRVSAGLRAAIEFLIADPAAARALATDSRSGGEGDTEYEEMIARFAFLLDDGAPSSDHLPPAGERSIMTVIVGVITCHIRAGTIDTLAEGDTDLVFLALLPYLGFAEASRWSTHLPPALRHQV
jgi:hypothetical protein